MRHRGLITATFLLTFAFQTADTRAASKVLYSDDFEFDLWLTPETAGSTDIQTFLADSAEAYIHQASVMKDLRESDPAKRFKCLGWSSQPPGYNTFVTLTTIPVRHRGGRLELNEVVPPGGQIVVEMLDAAGRPLERIPPSEPLTGDNLRHIVRFAGQTDVSATAGRAVALRFTMKNAELYSFAFRGEPQPLTLKKTPEKLKADQPVKIVCLGDSVTGIYYHTGGRRAYPEMLELALRMTFPRAEVTVVNAGISGNKTDDGLNRLQKDVLDLKPDLVTVMFGLNDLTVLPVSDYRTNLAQIVRRCRAVGAEVMLCTPNSVMTTPSRPVPKLIEYCHAIKEVAAEQQAPVCDIYAAYKAICDRDPLAWRLLLSDEIHPNMDGHKLNAEILVMAITGQKVSLKDVGPPQPTLPKTRALVKAGKPVRVLAMEPLDKLIASALTAVLPEAQIEVQSWPTSGQSLAQIEEAAKAVRTAPVDLVLIAVPAAVTPPAQLPSEEAIRAHSWILNWSLSFGQQEWDVVGITPSVLTMDLTPQEEAADLFSRNMIQAQHVNLVARRPNDHSPPDRVLEDWLRAQLTGK